MAKKKSDATPRQATPHTTTAIDVTTEVTESIAFGAVISDFVKNARQFFTRSAELIQRADESLERAKRFTEPETSREDEAVQAAIKQLQDDGVEDDEHHNTLAQPLHRFHRAVVARRNRAEQSRKAAAEHLNKLHNGYTTKERRRVEAVNEARRLKAEADERQRRQKEHDKLEAEALALEAASEQLSEREARYVEYVLAGTEASAAATAAGFKDGFKSAARLMASEKIQQAIHARREADLVRQQQQALREAPVNAEFVEERANITRAAGAKEVTRWKAVVEDADLFIAAVISGRHGIPRDVLVIDESVLNGYARSLHGLLNKWPGVRAVDETKVQ